MRCRGMSEIVETPAFRIPSIRAARRGLEEAIAMHRAGRISAGSLTALTGAYKGWVEIFLAEQELARLGIDKEVDGHVLGLDGGAAFDPMVPTPAVVTEASEADAGGFTVKATRKVQGFAVPSDF